MVTPGKLRQTIADALGLQDQYEKVDVHLRNLREAGLITKAKKGRGAADMGPQDAANLLIAVAGSELVKDSVKAVKRFGNLCADPASMSLNGLRQSVGLLDLPLLNLRSEHKFSEGLGDLIVRLAKDRVFTSEVRSYFSRDHWDAPNPAGEYLFVRLFFPYDAASILYGIRRKFRVHIAYGSLPVRDPRVTWDLSNLETDGTLLTVRVVDLKALTMISKSTV
jgi:hypothetical protein